jgi:hypothetical protein
MNMTITLTANAMAFLKDKVSGRIGYGAYLSTLLTAEQAREETRKMLAHQPAKTTRQSWSETGIRVD